MKAGRRPAPVRAGSRRQGGCNGAVNQRSIGPRRRSLYIGRRFHRARGRDCRAGWRDGCARRRDRPSGPRRIAETRIAAQEERARFTIRESWPQSKSARRRAGRDLAVAHHRRRSVGCARRNRDHGGEPEQHAQQAFPADSSDNHGTAPRFQVRRRRESRGPFNAQPPIAASKP